MLRTVSLFDRFFDEEFDDLFNKITYSSYKDDKSEKKIYYKNGMVHNENGPAIIHKDGKEEYWLEGCKVTKSDVESYIQNKEAEKLHQIWVNDEKYSIKGKYLKELKNKIEELSKK